MLSKGIKAHFSGCLTTTLDLKYQNKKIVSGECQRRGVYLVDVGVSKNKFFSQCKAFLGDRRSAIDLEVLKLLEEFPDEKVETLTHIYDKALTQKERFDIAEDLLKKYSSAKCVITSKIHAALPCLGLGTPVVLVVKRKDPKRYLGLDQFLNFIWFNGNFKLEKSIHRDLNGNIVNSESFKPYAEEMKKTCFEFIRSLL